ncbi:hypothetical protein EMIHUDRAFT_237411 [Emiliania huxleyi CCMP1516]|uniref:Uncharacterized protein n=2 Tax=Emiliania huxleyi TaxID=2903 RepID=A0A0D3JQ51_EMIH1|nr:hypothetical protein EMIHUDRAFT_238503 [Emiliania huxleyi CCMP1516]XP_005778065.1 hypothetical protein EMIHUDRAFT_237411 [Emiliania huxleyi CCMP1516]EOD24456.1 hypothetical protein EMIHUDRAFT_238503 [Emiliania huxleyi CCMP1516]EOD25636.1 hypothetical protein EMIHUDRAFT_237411 [Emiliania huxleyi CCMP1516]|eukprot:XP_005776885.1 hypothetical protein EMIHUDRAFT_238503 [Emiliania huxleyi CCMP1516]
MSTLSDLRREYATFKAEQKAAAAAAQTAAAAAAQAEQQAAAAAAEAAKEWEEMLEDLDLIERAIADIRSLHVQQRWEWERYLLIIYRQAIELPVLAVMSPEELLANPARPSRDAQLARR